MAVRFVPVEEAEERLSHWLARDILPAMVSHRGIIGAHLFLPATQPPMTREQSLRGPDQPIHWLMIATAYDATSLERVVAEHITPEVLRNKGACGEITFGNYALHCTATAEEVARTVPPVELAPEGRRAGSPGRGGAEAPGG